MSHPMNTNSRETAYRCIQALRLKYGDRVQNISDASEAKTRVLIIDEILQIIGWERDDFNPETPAGQGFIDYLLTIDGIPRAVVEAKRIGHTFRSPKFQMHETDYTLSYFRRAYGHALAGVLRQATNYAHEKEVQFAILTNGVEWLLVQVIPPPGKTVEELRGFYFGNILAEDSNFDLFWELLSKSSVIHGSLEEHLAQLNTVPANDSISVRSEFGDFRWKRPIADSFLREFYNRFFSEITDSSRRHMLEHCFTTDARLSQYQGDLKHALIDTAPSYLPSDTQDISPEEGERLLLEDTDDPTGRVILVTGSVGCGKTTLVTKVLVEAKQQKQQNLIMLKVDLIDEVSHVGTDASSALWRYIEEEWRQAVPDSYHLEKLRKYFGKEVTELRYGEYADVFQIDESEYIRREAELLRELRGDPFVFFTRCWRYYRQKQYGIALIIDNVDRASEAYQQQVYAFAHKLASRTGATIIVTMREFTFFRGQESGFLDVRSQDTIFHLQSPNLEQLLARRIRYVQQHMLKDHRVSRWKKSSNWEAFQQAAYNHAEMLKATFLLSESGRDILGLLASVSWHDVRYFLDTLRRLHMQLDTSSEPWVASEVIAALMTSFDSGRLTPVLSNIYRPSFTNYQCYYLKLRLLLMLVYGVKGGESRKGLSLSRILTFARLYGYHTRWTQRAIEELVRERFLECLEAPASSEYTKNYQLIETHTFRASPLAVILVQKVASQPIYLCLIGNDLPFHKPLGFEKYRSSLRSVLGTLDNEEFERAAIGLVIETPLGKIVADYLCQAYREEQPSGSLIKNLPEVSATERMLNQIVVKLRQYANVAEQKDPVPRGLVHQRSLFDDADDALQSSPFDNIPIPQNITRLEIEGSEQAPLIFWALVALRVSGKKLSSGVEITEVINANLVDDHHQKFPNNISRALRSPILQAQRWLLTDTTSHPRHKRFGLAEGWQHYWEEIFGSPAPDVR